MFLCICEGVYTRIKRLQCSYLLTYSDVDQFDTVDNPKLVSFFAGINVALVHKSPKTLQTNTTQNNISVHMMNYIKLVVGQKFSRLKIYSRITVDSQVRDVSQLQIYFLSSRACLFFIDSNQLCIIEVPVYRLRPQCSELQYKDFLQNVASAIILPVLSFSLSFSSGHCVIKNNVLIICLKMTLIKKSLTPLSGLLGSIA